MTLRILVVGAGIAGLAAARGLRVAGFRPDVVEALPATMSPGAGIYLPGNASRALRLLGLDVPLRPLGDLIFRQVFLDARGRDLFEMDVAGLWAGVGESRALSRADLQQVLLTGVGGEVRYDTEVRDVEIVDGAAKVAFSTGAMAEYDLVIGADGRRSQIRERIGLGGPAVPTGQIVYRAVVSGGPPLTDWTAVLGRRAQFVAMPMGGRRIYCYADETAPDTPDPADPIERLREVFGQFGGPVPAILDRIEKVSVARTDEVVLPSWSRGPVVLVGDAAHATAPTLAQGAAMSFEDGFVLGRELRRAEGDIPVALRAYEDRRRPRCAEVRDRTRERDRTRDVPPSLRDPMLRRRGLRIFTDHYRGLVPAV
ncbi:FAD-binding monooxygenase [Actinoplanes sp. SE50]|uniref:FAD-dependent monooxygenase n=1 Tax=unclassified Actinoplanes TaxID=2626549 RepID=UPI00023ECA96|nr:MULTISPECIES: FAD-dependent monooxygenase [unclassified Actinoplanes]AEV82052.1 monooxygenase, FAD-binding protein [Actinoplanes sp. SE50/110]ATO80451.1 FAD-binding monooxygenase [Actinoplanes sp. SE50]SLL97858.1 FAD-binding monooxygenase [Actinoplanes sp. SE50/110]